MSESFGLEYSNPNAKVFMAQGLSAGMSWQFEDMVGRFFRLYSNWTGGAYSLESS